MLESIIEREGFIILLYLFLFIFIANREMGRTDLKKRKIYISLDGLSIPVFLFSIDSPSLTDFAKLCSETKTFLGAGRNYLGE